MPTGMTNWDDSAGFNSTWRWGRDQGQVGNVQVKQKIRDLNPNEMAGYVAPGANQQSQVQSGAIAQQAAAAADPFAAQRPQYQGQLQTLMQGPQQGQVTSDIQGMRDAAGKPIGGPYMGMLEKLMTDPNSITQTPGSQFAMEQGQQALSRSKAAQGFLGSGNILSELQKQSQGMASQDYTQQLADTRAAAGLSQGIQGQGFNQAQGIYNASSGDLQNQYSRLAQLSGANSGSPSAAGQFLSNQYGYNQDAEAAQGAAAAQQGNVAAGSQGNTTIWKSGGAAKPAVPSTGLDWFQQVAIDDARAAEERKAREAAIRQQDATYSNSALRNQMQSVY